MSSRGKGPTKTRPARSSSLDGSVYTVSSSSSVSSISTIPSIEVSESGEESSTWQNSQSVPSVVDVDEEEPLPDEEHQTSKVSVDRERQLLLLFLLAQVCALHDPTPRTFTVHVLGLFEQGILDRESIQFLFDLGFVPSTTVDSRGLLITNSTTSAPARAPVNTRNRKRPKENLAVVTDERITSDMFIEDDDLEIEYLNSSRDMTTEMATTTELAIAGPTNVLHHVDSAVPGVTTLHSNQTLRSLEASSIRERLSQHESSDKNKKKSSKKTATGEPNSPVANSPPKSWDAANFPLSMSRYEREFKDITPLSSGSFGSVFRARRELDGHEYAVKKITFDEMGYSNESIDQVIREVQCLAAVNDHPNVVRYYTSWWEPTWMTGSIPSKNNQKHIENGNHSKASRKRFLQIEAGEANDKSEYSASSYSSSSSSSSSSDSDDDYYSLDGGTRSVEESTWESYRSHSVEPWNNAYDDSYMTKTEYRSRRRSARQSKKNSQTTTPYQYQISLYIQMQLCHPANLQDWIRERNKRIPESDHEQRIGPAVEIFQQICGGLAHIHSANVVHRDLKPANIFVSSDGKAIKIGDFGLSKKLKDMVNQQKSAKFDAKAPSSPQKSGTAQPESYAITPFRPGISSIQALVERNKVGKNLTSGIGTASYAAPEQVQSKTYGTAVDIFSLGLIFLELVSCFETEHERLHNLQQCRFRNLPKWLDENYPEISSTILACTNPKACDRPSASELIDAAKLQSPRNQNEVHKLKRQLAEKNRIIAEKDEFIENMRLEMAKLHELLVQMKSGACVHQNGEQAPSKKNEKDDIIVTDVLTFDDDVE